MVVRTSHSSNKILRHVRFLQGITDAHAFSAMIRLFGTTLRIGCQICFRVTSVYDCVPLVTLRLRLQTILMWTEPLKSMVSNLFPTLQSQTQSFSVNEIHCVPRLFIFRQVTGPLPHIVTIFCYGTFSFIISEWVPIWPEDNGAMILESYSVLK